MRKRRLLMKSKKSVLQKTVSIVHDGKLTQEEALKALRVASQSATEALPAALGKCTTDEERQKVMTDRDLVVLAYLNSLQKTLVQTGALFETTAINLETEAENVRRKAGALTDVTDAINLLTELIRLAASLALAFG
jgi:hypothetical protein